MADMKWDDAIFRVLAESRVSMSPKDIATEIAAKGYRVKLGETPSNTVGARLSQMHKSIVEIEKESYGTYIYKSGEEEIGEHEESSIIQSYGMFWDRNKVIWKTNPRLLGEDVQGSDITDFCGCTGVYLLHDLREIIYVGRSTGRSIGARMSKHTIGRLATRWNRFSWFVFTEPEGEGGTISVTSNEIITAMEAILIETIEPRQNRRRGDHLQGNEFNQVVDPDIAEKEKKALFDEFMSR